MTVSVRAAGLVALTRSGAVDKVSQVCGEVSRNCVVEALRVQKQAVGRREDTHPLVLCGVVTRGDGVGFVPLCRRAQTGEVKFRLGAREERKRAYSRFDLVLHSLFD